eukprot:2233281-Amphidinium_carterae.1
MLAQVRDDSTVSDAFLCRHSTSDTIPTLDNKRAEGVFPFVDVATVGSAYSKRSKRQAQMRAELPEKPLVIVIAGPTAVGKSAAALELADALQAPAEIVSADSVQ